MKKLFFAVPIFLALCASSAGAKIVAHDTIQSSVFRRFLTLYSGMQIRPSPVLQDGSIGVLSYSLIFLLENRREELAAPLLARTDVRQALSEVDHATAEQMLAMRSVINHAARELEQRSNQEYQQEVVAWFAQCEMNKFTSHGLRQTRDLLASCKEKYAFLSPERQRGLLEFERRYQEEYLLRQSQFDAWVHNQAGSFQTEDMSNVMVNAHGELAQAPYISPTPIPSDDLAKHLLRALADIEGSDSTALNPAMRKILKTIRCIVGNEQLRGAWSMQLGADLDSRMKSARNKRAGLLRKTRTGAIDNWRRFIVQADRSTRRGATINVPQFWALTESYFRSLILTRRRYLPWMRREIMTSFEPLKPVLEAQASNERTLGIQWAGIVVGATVVLTAGLWLVFGRAGGPYLAILGVAGLLLANGIFATFSRKFRALKHLQSYIDTRQLQTAIPIPLAEEPPALVLLPILKTQ